MEKLLIYNGALPTKHIYTLWEEIAKEENLGAVCVFSGIVREENNISALSFDIYLPLLQLWITKWNERVESSGVKIFMAHSNGDVSIGESSFMCAIISKNRALALKIYDKFIEDFKANAPIWKYDVIDGKRVYAKDRSKMLGGAGILADKKK